MEARAVAKYVRMSPQKIRKVVALIRGKSVNEALNALHFIPQRAATPVEKVLRSAAANAVSREEGAKINPDELVVKEVFVDQGPSMKRNNPGPMGRASMLMKRSAHITVVVTDEKKKRPAGPVKPATQPKTGKTEAPKTGGKTDAKKDKAPKPKAEDAKTAKSKNKKRS
jgi:large subunit ribosomal protein L22